MEEDEDEVTAQDIADAIANWTPEERLSAAQEFLQGEQRDRQAFADLSADADADADAAGKAFREILRGRNGL